MLLEITDKEGRKAILSTEGEFSVSGDPRLVRHLTTLTSDVDLPFAHMRSLIDEKYVKINDKGMLIIDKKSNDYLIDVFIGKECPAFGYSVKIL